MLAIVPAACGGDDDEDAAPAGGTTTETATGPQNFPAEEQAVRAFIGDEQDGRTVKAIICTPEGANATCIASFDEGACERYTVESGARLVVRSRGETDCPRDGGS